MKVKTKERLIEATELPRLEVAKLEHEKNERKRAEEALQKSMEEALRESEGKYRSLVENSNDGIVIVQGRRIVFANKVVKEISGYSEEELKKLSFLKLIAPSSRSAVLKRYFARLAGLQVKNRFELEVLTKEGKIIPCEISSSAITYHGKNAIQAALTDITERKQAEEALQNTRDYLENLINYANAPIIVWDPESKITRFNHAFEHLAGYTAGEVIGKELKMLLPEASRNESLTKIARALSGEHWESLEIPILCKDGDVRVVLCNSANIYAQDGRTLLATIAQGQDITERKRAEETLRESENKYRTLLESLPQKIFLKDRNSVYVSCNENYAWGLKIRPDEIAGKTDYDFFPKELAEKYRADDKSVMESGKTEDIEESYIQDGREVIVHTVKTPVKHEQGNIIGLLGIFWDITERKRMEETLRQSEERYRTLFESKLDGVCVIDETMKLLLANQAAADIFGFDSVEEILGVNPFEFIPPEERERVLTTVMKDMFQNDLRQVNEFRMISKEGEEKWISAVGATTEYGGELAGLVSFRHVTEQKRAEEQLEHSCVDLAETVSRAMSSRDPYTASHQRRVAELARLVGEKMGLDKDRIQGLYIGGLLHDIGKISTPETILSKPGELTEEEWAIIHAHAKQGYKILKDTNLPWPVADMAVHHHERLDGSGYPHGIGGDKLRLEVRILGVCDVVEAMSSHRPYRPAKSKKEVLGEIKRGRGTKYDANVVDIMLQIIESGEFELQGSGNRRL